MPEEKIIDSWEKTVYKNISIADFFYIIPFIMTTVVSFYVYDQAAIDVWALMTMIFSMTIFARHIIAG